MAIWERWDGHWEWSWPVLLACAALAAALLKLLLKGLSVPLRKVAQRSSSIWDDVLVDLVDGLKYSVVFVWALALLSPNLDVSDSTKRVLVVAMVAATIFQIGLWGLHVIRSWRNAILNKLLRSDPSAASAMGLVSISLQALFLTTLVLIGLSNLGVDIGALLAGLGVGGIAVALAAQNVLGDLFASLSIVLDKPFIVGDFIASGSELGTVEHIGIKTTRLRSLSGEELVFSNKDLLESRLRNYKRMRERRVVQKFGVVYATPAGVLERIPTWVKEIVEAQKGTRFDRCHLAAYGAYSLDFEFVFWVEDAEYNVYMDAQQAILLAIIRKFGTEGVAFAFPTQSLILEHAQPAGAPA